MNIKQIRYVQARVWHIYVHIRQYVHKYKKEALWHPTLLKSLTMFGRHNASFLIHTETLSLYI